MLETWFLPKFPARIFSLRGFFGQVFSSLCLTEFISVVRSSSAPLVCSFFSCFLACVVYIYGITVVHLLLQLIYFISMYHISSNNSHPLIIPLSLIIAPFRRKYPKKSSPHPPLLPSSLPFIPCLSS